MEVNGEKQSELTKAYLLFMPEITHFSEEKKRLNYNYLDFGKAFTIMSIGKLLLKSACAIPSTNMWQ